MKLLLRWAIVAVALFVAAYFVPGIQVKSNAWVVFGAMAIILSLVNLFIRPVLKLLSFPLLLLSFGLFALVINAITLWLASFIAEQYFQVGFHVDGFVPAFLGSLVVSIVSTVLSWMFEDND